MKGAIGNAFILNMVISFIIIFFMLLIGSIAYSNAYKVNRFLLDSVVNYAESSNSELIKGSFELPAWYDRVNIFLQKSGYILSSQKKTCPSFEKIDDETNKNYGYVILKNTKVGDYDYCIYQKRYYELDETDDLFTKKRFSYMVISYMKFDFPIIGEFIKLPITSESKVIVKFH